MSAARPPDRSPTARALSIAARAAHLFAMAVFLGGLYLAPGSTALATWGALAAGTGTALLATELAHRRGWATEGRGVAVLVHVALLALLAADGLARAGATVSLLAGAVGSHMPRALRHWSFRHGRVIE